MHGTIYPQEQDFPIPSELHEISCLPMSPDRPPPSKWQHSHLVYQLLLPIFVSSADLLMVHSVLSPRTLMKMLNSIGTSTDHWCTPLGTGFQLCFKLLTTIFWAQQLLSPCHCPLIQPVFHQFAYEEVQGDNVKSLKINMSKS